MSKSTRGKALGLPECPWETGEYGRDEEFVRVASAAEMAVVDKALDLQMISIRLERGLIEVLKEIAEHHNIGYQPMIRDLLNRFAVAEIKKILSERLAQVERHEKEQKSTFEPTKAFMEERTGTG